MTDYSYELHAYVEEGGQRHPLDITISEPFKADGADDWACRVSCRLLFKRDKDIFGVDAEQAKELAKAFVRQLLACKRVIDEHGQSVSV